MIVVHYSSSFKKSIKKYSSHRKQIEKRIKIFIENPYDQRLKTHKLSGELEGYYSFSINFSLRVLFEFTDEHTVGFIDLGTHEVYKK